MRGTALCARGRDARPVVHKSALIAAAKRAALIQTRAKEALGASDESAVTLTLHALKLRMPLMTASICAIVISGKMGSERMRDWWWCAFGKSAGV